MRFRFLFCALLLVVTTACLEAQTPRPPDQEKQNAVLGSEKIMAFIATKDAKRALAFYHDMLGLRLMSREPIALMFDANGVILRVQLVSEVSIAPYTVLGWQVPDIVATVKKLQKAGVTCMRVPAVTQDELGIWKAPDGTRVAWFKDPDGHTLSVTQF